MGSSADVIRETVAVVVESQTIQPLPPPMSLSAPPLGEAEELQKDMRQVG